jgi:sugar phosphate isomerase/epimerase
MRLGVCVPVGSFVSQDKKELEREESLPRLMEHLRSVGVDFLEFSVGVVKPEGTLDEFEKFASQVRGREPAPEAFNSFIPGDLKVTGPDADQPRLANYLRHGLERLKRVGAKVVAFGSGASRTIPDGFPRDETNRQLAWFLHRAADFAGSGLTIAIEPLNRRETNVVNTVEEAAALARRIDRPNVGVLADVYHMMVENEPLQHLADAGDLLAHVHVADSDRRYPGSADFPFDELFQLLKRIEYQGRVSVECVWEDFRPEAEQSMTFLKEVSRRWQM